MEGSGSVVGSLGTFDEAILSCDCEARSHVVGWDNENGNCGVLAGGWCKIQYSIEVKKGEKL